ncbi:DUF5684 domain-containing protein [Allosphingosinicella deserti]|uniref:Uncharacterized protein n=1 Tax=Allosphingosinicella deserti TaxID=2116704 RepID=A0A2P7QS08_9SPHN|nr:hypothetical protein C7I55_10685 [Sphingomonas deserti]
MILQIAQLAPSLILSSIVFAPFYILFRRAGRSGWWALLGFLPLVGLLVVPWMLVLMSRGKAQVQDVFR